MNNTVKGIFIITILAIAGYIYFTRPVSGPQQDITFTAQDKVDESTLARNQSLYRISQDTTKVRFTIDEELRGKPFTVVGETNQAAADIVIEGRKITVGKISIDARTFVTDSAQRDGAVKRFILKTETSGNEFVTFTPNGPVMLSGQIKTDVPFTFTVDGTFTISGISKPGTLSVIATQSDTALTGTVSADLKRSDFDLVIPNIPFVANVPDEFKATADFTATKVN